MGQAAVRALIAAAQGRLRALEGKPSEPSATFLGAHGIDPRTLQLIVVPPRRAVRIRTDGGMRFSEAAARYIEAKRKAGKMTTHTQRQRETVFRLFKTFADDAPLAAAQGRHMGVQCGRRQYGAKPQDGGGHAHRPDT